MNDAYAKALKHENDRILRWAKTRQGAFEASMLHLDEMTTPNADDDTPDPTWASDHGEGARRIYAAVDDTPKPTRKQLIDRAAIKISRNAPECLPTFWAVIRNGKNWKESVCELILQKALDLFKGKRRRPQKAKTPHLKRTKRRRGKKRSSTTQKRSTCDTSKKC